MMSKAPLPGDYRVKPCGHSGCDRRAGASRRRLTPCSSAFTQRNNVHTSDDDLQQGQAALAHDGSQ